MRGIVNGIDYAMYDPAKDDLIFKNYSASNFRTNKKVNKEKLQGDAWACRRQEKVHDRADLTSDRPKGLNLVNYCIERLVDDNTQLVVIGTGEAQYENMFRHFCMEIPGPNIRKHLLFRGSGSQVIRSGRCLFDAVALEPCGLTQLISFRYGTVPIVRETQAA